MPTFADISYADPPPPDLPQQSGDIDALAALVARAQQARGAQPPSVNDASMSVQQQALNNLINQQPGVAAPYKADPSFANAPAAVPDMPDAPTMSPKDTVLHALNPMTAVDAAKGMAMGAYQAARLPGDVLTGKVDPTSQEGIHRAADFAMTFGMLGAPIPKPEGSFGIAGGRLPSTNVSDLPTAAPQWNNGAREYLKDSASTYEMLAGLPSETENASSHVQNAASLRQMLNAGPSAAPPMDASPDMWKIWSQASQIPDTYSMHPDWNAAAQDYMRRYDQAVAPLIADRNAPTEVPVSDSFRNNAASVQRVLRDIKAAGPGGYEVPAGSPPGPSLLLDDVMARQNAVPDLLAGSLEEKLARLLNGQSIGGLGTDSQLSAALQDGPGALPWTHSARDYLAATDRRYSATAQDPAQVGTPSANEAPQVIGAIRDMKQAGPGSYVAPDGGLPNKQIIYDNAMEVQNAPARAAEAAAASRGPSPLLQNKALTTHAAKVGMSPQEFMDTMFGEGHDPVEVSGSGNKLNLEANLANGSYMQRTFNRNGSVDHAFFKVPKGAQDTGIGKQILSQQIPLYEAMGRTTVNVHANIDVGGYAWGRYGFVPDQASWNDLRQMAGSKLDEVQGQLPADVHSRMQRILSDPNPKAMWPAVDEDAPVTMPAPRTFPFNQPLQMQTQPLGKHLFLGSNWHGKLDLNDQPTMERFYDYVSRKK